MKTQPRSRRAKVGLAAAAILGLSIAAGPTAMAQPQSFAPQVAVTPSTNLPATAAVTVDISGFQPESAVFTQQCAQVAPNVIGCDYDDMQSVDLDADGAAAIELTVNRVFEAHDENGDLIGEVDCATLELDPGCFVAVGNPQEGTGAPIFFASEE